MKKLVLAAMLGLMAAGGPAGAFSLPELLPGGRQAPQQPSPSAPPMVLAQSGDASIRVQQLEEQIRQLNGRIEEMSFQLLQMQEQMRKTQEDNEFRFQELEKSENGAAGKPAVRVDVESLDTDDGFGQPGVAQGGQLDAVVAQRRSDHGGVPVADERQPGQPGNRSSLMEQPEQDRGHR